MSKLTSLTLLVGLLCAMPAFGQSAAEQFAIEGRAAGDRGDERACAELYRKAAVRFRAEGRLDFAARAAWEVVAATDPRKDPSRTWDEHARNVEVALGMARQAKDLKLEAMLLLQKSDTVRPGVAPNGTWEATRAVADQAVEVSSRSGDKRNLYITLKTAAEIHMPLAGRGGSWARAFELHHRAAEIATELGDVSAQAEHFTFMGTCALPGRHPNGKLEEARTLYTAGEALHRQAKEPDEAARAAFLFATTFVADCDPNPSPAGLELARRALVRAIRQFRESGRAREHGRALLVLACFRLPGKDPSGSWADGAELYRLAAEQLDEAGLADEAADARRMIARCTALAARESAPAASPVPALRR